MTWFGGLGLVSKEAATTRFFSQEAVDLKDSRAL